MMMCINNPENFRENWSKSFIETKLYISLIK
jgi:hypothetical protein